MSASRRGFEALCKSFVQSAPGIGVSYGGRGRGLFLEKGTVRAGEKLLEIPRSTWYPFSAEAFRKGAPSTIVERLDELDRRAFARGRLAACALCTLGLLYGEKDSLTGSYLDTLPESLDDETFNPALWNSDELNELETSSVIQKANGFRRMCEETVSFLGVASLSNTDYTRFSCLVRSRALSFTQANGEFFFSLIPALDLVNHEPKNPKAELCYTYRDDATLDGIQLVAKTDLHVGDEITFSYGPIGNAKLLSIYGFALDDNEDDSVVLYPEEALDFFRQRQSIVQIPDQSPISRLMGTAGTEKANNLPDIITMQSGLPIQALAHLRTHFLTTEDKVNLQCRGSDPDQTSTTFPVSARNERLVLGALRDLCEHKLEYKSAAIEDDIYFLKLPRTRDDFRHHLVRTRLGEKLIWAHTIKLIDQSMKILN